MKILHISKFFPPVPGGIETVVHALAEGMNRRGHRADVLCANTERHTVTDTMAAGYCVTRSASLGMAMSTAISPMLVVETRRRAVSYDVIDVQMPDPMAAMALRLVRPRAPIVLHWQSDVVSQQRALRVYEPLQRWLLERADAIVATTQHYADASPWLQQHGEKVHVIANGMDDPQRGVDRALVETIRRSHAGRRMVFSLGRMTGYKGFEHLIDAAQHMPADAVIVVGGGGDLLESHRAAATARGLGDRIRFVGRLDDASVAAHFAACTVFVLPSVLRSEAFGMVILEAMAAEKPVVATRIEGSGVPWVNQHGITGLNVPVRDGRALAEAIGRLLDDAPLADAMGRAGRARYERELTADRMVEACLRLYERLTPSRSAFSAPRPTQTTT